MRIAYLTLDEVNQHLALSLAAEQDVRLEVQARPEITNGREFDAVIYDPDSSPWGERAANLTAILACPVGRPVAVHSYDISPEQLQVLRHRGAVVARRLGAGMFARIIAAVHAAQRQQTVA